MGGPSYQQQRLIGGDFEFFICALKGWTQQTDPRLQAEAGDTVCRKEIKYDRQCHQTGRLFVETEESYAVDGVWHASAILVAAELLVIGDCSTLWTLDKDIVRHWGKKGTVFAPPHGRSRGFLVPTERATRLGNRESLGFAPLAIETDDDLRRAYFIDRRNEA